MFESGFERDQNRTLKTEQCNSKKQQQGNREACDANRKKVFRVFVENARKREGNKLQLAKTSRKKPA